MRYPGGNVVFRILLGILALELAYVAYQVLRPPENAPHDAPHAAAVAHATMRPEPSATPVEIAVASPVPVATVRVAAASPAATTAMKTLPAINALTYIDDANFTYEGRWEHIRGRDDGRRMGTSSRSFHLGDAASFSFHGRFMILFGIVGPGGGKAVIDIDGGREHGIVDFRGTSKKLSALVYESSVLTNGTHAVRITVAPSETSDDAKPGYVNIDGAYVGS